MKTDIEILAEITGHSKDFIQNNLNSDAQQICVYTSNCLAAMQQVREQQNATLTDKLVEAELKVGDPVFIKPFPVWDKAALPSIGKYGLIHSDDGQFSYWVTIYHGGRTLVPKSCCQPVLTNLPAPPKTKEG